MITEAERLPAHHPAVRIDAPEELDVASAPAFAAQLLGAPHGADVIVDLSATRFIGARGLGALVAAREQARSEAAHLRLEHVPPQISRLLAITDLTGLFDDIDQ
jgi:anti-anti-sigma factor